MRVLMTADAVGGVWQYALQLARLLAHRDAEIVIAVMGPPPSNAQRAEALTIPGLALRDKPFALEWMPNPWEDVDRAGSWLLALEAEFDPDVVHINGYAHASIAWHAPTLVVAHSCVCSWWHAVHRKPAPEEWNEYVSRVRAGLTAATAVVAPTCAMARDIARFYQVTRDLSIIANCRDEGDWHPGAKEPFVFAAGRAWDAAKNIAALATVAREVQWPIYVAGEASGPGVTSTELHRLHPVGRLDSAQMADWMGRAAIYALPARYEPFGLSILEAALSGCALVLGDIPSLRENWSGVAHFVHPDRPDELRFALQALIGSPDARQQLGDAARRRAISLSPATHVAAYERLYRDMVATHGGITHSARPV